MMNDMTSDQNYLPQLVEDGPYQGWMAWPKEEDAFEAHIGPLYMRQLPDGAMQAGFTPQNHHLNGQGHVHGGALMGFADYALFSLSRAWELGKFVTLHADLDFLAPASANAPIIASGTVEGRTRAMIFVHGVMVQHEQTILRFSGIIKKIA